MAKKTTDSERIPLFMHLKTSKENRETEQTEWYAGKKFAELNRIYRNNMNEAMKTNLWFLVFMLPFLVLTIWALPYMLNLSDQRFFIGGLGLDYHPGVTSQLELALVGRLQVHTFYFALLIPSFAIMGLGLAGALYVARKMFYEEDFKVTRCFFTGIKKYWWKMIIVTTLMGTLIFAEAEIFIEFYKLVVLNAVTGGWYALLFFGFVIGILILMCLMQIPPQIVTYDKLKFRYMFQNSVILAIENALWTFIFLVFILAPILLVVYVPFLSIIIYVIMFMFGAMYYIMINLQIGNYSFDLYMNPIYAAIGENITVKKDKSVKEVKVEEKKTSNNNTNNNNKNKKKKAQNQPYVNPKKKKSQKKK